MNVCKGIQASNEVRVCHFEMPLRFQLKILAAEAENAGERFLDGISETMCHKHRLKAGNSDR